MKRKDSKAFESELAKTHPKIALLTDYKLSQEQVRVVCSVCDHQWDTTPNYLLKHKNIEHCHECKRRYLEASLFYRFKEKYPEIEVLSRYDHSGSLIHLKCSCGHLWSTKASKLLKMKGCSSCRKRSVLHKKHKEFVQYVAENLPNIDVIGDYSQALKPIKLRCRIDGFTWATTPAHVKDAVKRGTSGCPECNVRNLRKTNEQFLEDLCKVNNDVLVVDTYVGSFAALKTICKVCNHEWNITPSDLLSGYGCPCCARTGYDPNKDSVLYLYDMGDYIGFGITNNLKSRDKQHRTQFKKMTVYARLIATYESEGSVIKNLEKHLKSQPIIADSGIVGFRTESVCATHLPALLDIIKDWLYSGNHTFTKDCSNLEANLKQRGLI